MSKYPGNQGPCTECGVSWFGGDIPKESHYMYGPPYKYSKCIGVYDRDKDGTVAWQCPGCGATWDRFTNELICES